jgi:hypothetical protein
MEQINVSSLWSKIWIVHHIIIAHHLLDGARMGEMYIYVKSMFGCVY